MIKPLFNWGGQYCLEETKAFSNFKNKKHKKPTESKVLRKQYIKKLRRLLKLKKGDYYD